MALIIRKARASDEDSAVALLQQLLGTPAVGWDRCRAIFRELLQSERGEIAVAEVDGELVGVITWSINLALRYGGCYAQIEELVVDAAKRGTGAGAALVREAIARARAAGCAEIGLYALEHNRPFYEKLGFVYAGPELRQPLDG